MTRRYFKTMLVCLLLAAANYSTQAAVVYQYGFENLCGNLCTTPSPWTGVPDVLATGLSASSWATNYSGGFVSYDGSCGTTTCQALAISHNNQPASTTYTLTFTIAPGKSLSVTSLSFWNRESATGPTTASITINGTPAISTLTLAGTTGTNTGTLTPATGFNNLTGTFTLVITLTGATGTAGTFRLDDFVINGTVGSSLNAYAVTGGGSFCAGDTGVNVGLAGSDTAVSYQLKNANYANVGTAVTGTGSAISFGLQTAAGSYTVLATKISTGDTLLMTGSALVTVNAAPVVTLTTPPAQCGGSVTLDAGNAGSQFSWSDQSSLQTTSTGISGTYAVTVTNTNSCTASASVVVTINTLPTILISPLTSNICAGAAVTLTASGATTYVWSNAAATAAITLHAGSSNTYSVTGTDLNSCTASASASVTVAAPVTNSVTQQLCSGQSYNGHNVAGTYIDTLSTAGGCDSIVTSTITVLPANHTTTTQTICFGGSYNGHSTSGTFNDTLSAAGGCDSIVTSTITVMPANQTTTAQTICFGNSYNGHSASGSFSDTLSAAGGCDSIVTLNLTVLPEISIALTHSICHGDTFNGHTTSGTFTDTLTAAGGCDSIVYTQLTVHALPHVTLYLTFDTICNNAAAITMSGGLPAGGYYSGAGIVDSQFVPSLAPLGKDTIYYNYTDTNGCYKNRYEFAYTEVCTDTTVGINELNKTQFNVMPNPTQDILNIENTGLTGNCFAEVLDLLGRLVITQPLDINNTKLSLRELPAGIYVLSITQSNNRIYSTKVVKD